MSYKEIDLRGILGSNPNGFWDTSTKTRLVQHYNGPKTPEWIWDDPVEWIKIIVRGHMATGRFSPGWNLGTCAYHDFIFPGVVYRVNNYGAMLPHCGNTEWNRTALAQHICIGRGQRADEATLQTAAERAQDHLDAMKAGRSAFKGHREVGSSACPGTLMNDLILPYRRGESFGEKPQPVKPEPRPEPATGRVREVIWACNADSDAWHWKVAGAGAAGMKAAGLKSSRTRRNLHAVRRARAEKHTFTVVVGDKAAAGVDREFNLDGDVRVRLDESGAVRLADGNIRDESRWRVADLCDMGGLDETKALAAHTAFMNGNKGGSGVGGSGGGSVKKVELKKGLGKDGGNGPYTRNHPTHYNWSPEVDEYVHDLVNRSHFRGKIWIVNYEGHPPGYEDWEPWSWDIWGFGGRGDPLPESLRKEVFDEVFNDSEGPDIAWTITCYRRLWSRSRWNAQGGSWQNGWTKFTGGTDGGDADAEHCGHNHFTNNKS